MPSIHLAPLFRALESRGDVDVMVRLAHPLPPARRALGWHDDLAGYRHAFLSRRHAFWHAARAAWADRRRLHFVHGIWGERAFMFVLLVLAACGAEYIVFSEGQDPRLRRSRVKVVAQRILARLVLKRASAFLPVSSLSLRFHESLGVRLPPTFPFCYFHPPAEAVRSVTGASANAACRLVFVARLDADKGLEILLQALSRLDPTASPHRLLVVGDGEARPTLEAMTESLGLGDRVTFEGRVPSSDVGSRILTSDLLVLPTRWDGWGMVVNEALAVGVPVVATDRCGAADLIVPGWNGYVFPCDDVPALATILRAYIDERNRWAAMAVAALDTAAAVEAARGAEYVVAISAAVRGGPAPVAPWQIVLDAARRTRRGVETDLVFR